MSPRGRGIASVSLLSALLVGYGVILYFDDDGGALQPSIRRYLQGSESDDPAAADENNDPSRVLAKNGDSPPALDEVPGEFIVKPWVGYAASDVLESYSETKILVASAQSSSNHPDYPPRHSVDPVNTNHWESTAESATEWLQIDLGAPHNVQDVYIKWGEAYAADYTIQVALERLNCRKDGRSCADEWMSAKAVTGKANADPTLDAFEEGVSPQGVRYMRILLQRKATGMDNYSIFYIDVHRKKMVVGHEPTTAFCGATLSAVSTSLLSAYGGTLVQTYENAEFFMATMTEAQKDAMFADACTFTVEPNYVVRARGGAAGAGDAEGRGSIRGDSAHRNLAIPEFNAKDEQPINWGLERISSHGRRNGKYTWFHEGTDTHIYLFDTGVYPDHSDWNKRDGTSRLQNPVICAGTAADYASTNHGTHLMSIAAGWLHGTAKSATLHPIQVLDANGEGSTSSFLCGVEKVLQDMKDYNAVNAPKKMRAIVNLSLGVNGHSDALDKAVEDLTDVGFTVVIAAGDNNGNACFYSPYTTAAITVGALMDHTEGFNDKTATSNYGQCIDIWAPGEGIYGASNVGEFESELMSGTSVAAAFASGAASLFYEGINTKGATVEELSGMVKENLMNKAEINILREIGHGSPSKMLQTTVSRCSLNSHCEAGLTCLFDGTCRDLSKPLK